jgi:hypothetical protein
VRAQAREAGRSVSRLDNGREVLCTLALPLPVSVVGAIGLAIVQAVEGLGYTNVDLLTDGTDRIVATPTAPEVIL